MKKIILCILLLAGAAAVAPAQTTQTAQTAPTTQTAQTAPTTQTVMDGQVAVSNLSVTKSGGALAVAMDIDVESLHLRTNHEVVLTPTLVGDDGHEQRLPSITIMGYRRYLYNVRNNVVDMSAPYTYRKHKVSTIAYRESTPYEPWMDNCYLDLVNDNCGCRNALVATSDATLAQRKKYVPDYVYVTPQAEVKVRTLEGTAYVDFVVDKTDIRPEYHNNAAEIGKINSTIDAVSSDNDTVIDNIWLKGYASPESPYAHNTVLAKGRVEAIKDYVVARYALADSLITTDYEPENWDGLRRYVEQATLEHKDQLLAIIDSGGDADAREATLKRQYPAEYRQLLRDCYPYLRRTDYRVTYTIRGYTDLDEIRALIHSAPEKLSLNEMYLLAQTLTPGSDEFNDIFDIAVAMYPDDPVANINAANSAMQRGDYARAAQLLTRAGDSSEAQHAREVLRNILADE